MGTQETDTSDEQLYLQRDLKNFFQLSAYQSVHIRFFLSPPPQRNLESECNIYTPPPPHETSSEYIPHGFHFHKCSQLYRENRGSVNSYQQAQHFVSSIIYYQWYESLHREGGKIALQFVAHFAPLSLSLSLSHFKQA